MRKVRQSHDLGKKLKAGRDHSLRSNNRSENSKDQAEVECSWWYRVEERVGIGCAGGVLCDEGRLPDVRQQDTRKSEQKPRDLNCSLTESAEISKESFDTGKGEQQATQRLPAICLVAHKVSPGIVWTEGSEHSVVMCNEVVDSSTEVEE